MLRPFAATVCPGCDERHLGAAEPPADLLGPALRRALGIAGPEQAWQCQTLAFVQMLALPEVCLLRRRADGPEPLGPSPLWQGLDLARRAAGLPALAEQPPAARPQRVLDARPVAEPLPVVADAARWPASLSASAVEAWRACPYRFFARSLLGLAEDEELDQMAGKRDYGDWLHAVLRHFHADRTPTTDAAADLARLQACAAQVDAEQAWSDGELLPYQASFEALAPAYLRWLHAHEAEGWRWWQGERELRVQPPELDGSGLHGRLDRLDRRGDDGAVQILDYKTGSTAGLKTRVAEGLEDTQLVFYAALALAAGEAREGDVQAAYLALDDRDGPQRIAHAQVARDAQVLLRELGGEWRRARAGEPLRALGRGEGCDWCEMRGLCRRDHWAEAPGEGADE